MQTATPINRRASMRGSLGACALVAAMTLALGMGQAAAARGGGGANRGAMANTSVSGANRGAGGYNKANVNTGDRNRNNVNTGHINTGNVKVNHNDVNVNIDGGYHGYPGYGHPGYRPPGYVYHPVAAGVAIGAMAVTTAAIVGSYYRTLPTSCTVVIRNGISYHYCGSVYYQQTWSGNDVVYVVVNP